LKPNRRGIVCRRPVAVPWNPTPAPASSTPPSSLLVRHGLDGTTLRMITAEAKANLAAVNYHFGSKEALIEAVFRRRLTWLNEQRIAALDAFEAEAKGAPLKPRQIVEAFFGVAIRMAADKNGGQTFMRLLGRTYTEPTDFMRSFLAEEYAEVIARFKAPSSRPCPTCRRRNSSGASIS
jgi:AcrR family transcriptional regulator